jgi:hypothetical protein
VYDGKMNPETLTQGENCEEENEEL